MPGANWSVVTSIVTQILMYNHLLSIKLAYYGRLIFMHKMRKTNISLY